MGIIDKIIKKFLYIRYCSKIKNLSEKEQCFVESFDAKIALGLQFFKAEVGGDISIYFPRFAEIIKILDEYKPKNLVELGSGRTSLLFMSYVAQTGASYTNFEQSPEWVDISNQAIATMGNRPAIRLVGVREVDNIGARYVEDIPIDADFIYIDAPYIKRKNFATFTGKGANLDVPDLLARGGRPKVIMVDGRTDTVDLILKSDAAKDYFFHPEFIWAFERSKYRAALDMNRHTIFIRK